MICTKKFLYSAGFVFLFSVFTVFGISPNTNAASWTSSDISFSTITANSAYDFSSLGFDNSFSPYYIQLHLNSVDNPIYSYWAAFSICVSNASSCSSSGSPINFGYIAFQSNFAIDSWYAVTRTPFTFGFSFADRNSFISNFPSFNITLSDEPFSSGITPEGSIEITENGTFDVTSYAEAVVNVSTGGDPGSGGSNYHDDLVSINNSIIICAGVALVIYFFYAIYRMMFKGVKS